MRVNECAHVGLDVRAHAVVAAAVKSLTGELLPRRLSANPTEVLAWVRSLPGQVAAAYEAGPTGFALARTLCAGGARCEVLAPHSCAPTQTANSAPATTSTSGFTPTTSCTSTCASKPSATPRPAPPEKPCELACGVAAQHSVTFRRRGGRTEIDVHGRLHKALPSLTLAERLYRAAPTLPFGEHPVAVLPSDAALVHAAIYAQGTRGRVVSRGVVDVAMLLQSPHHSIDWDEVIGIAHGANALTPVQRVVRLAHELIDRELPASLAATFRAHPASRSDRLLWNLITTRRKVPLPRRLTLEYVRAWEVAPRDGQPRLDPLAYLRDRYHARSRLATLGLLLRYPIKRLWQRLRRRQRARIDPGAVTPR